MEYKQTPCSLFLTFTAQTSAKNWQNTDSAWNDPPGIKTNCNHCYTILKDTYHSVSHAALGLSDHCLVHLLQTVLYQLLWGCVCQLKLSSNNNNKPWFSADFTYRHSVQPVQEQSDKTPFYTDIPQRRPFITPALLFSHCTKHHRCKLRNKWNIWMLHSLKRVLSSDTLIWSLSGIYLTVKSRLCLEFKAVCTDPISFYLGKCWNWTRRNVFFTSAMFVCFLATLVLADIFSP